MIFELIKWTILLIGSSSIVVALLSLCFLFILLEPVFAYLLWHCFLLFPVNENNIVLTLVSMFLVGILF